MRFEPLDLRVLPRLVAASRPSAGKGRRQRRVRLRGPRAANRRLAQVRRSSADRRRNGRVDVPRAARSHGGRGVDRPGPGPPRAPSPARLQPVRAAGRGAGRHHRSYGSRLSHPSGRTPPAVRTRAPRAARPADGLDRARRASASAGRRRIFSSLTDESCGVRRRNHHRHYIGGMHSGDSRTTARGRPPAASSSRVRRRLRVRVDRTPRQD